MSLWKRGKVYWSYLTMDGVRYSQSTGTGNKEQAKTIEQRFRDDLNLRRHQIVQTDPKMPFGQLAAQFLAGGSALGWHIDRLKILLPYWGDVPIGRIHKSMVADYRKRRHAAKTITDTTVNRDLEALRHILFWAVDEGLLTTNPLSRLRMVPERRKPRLILGVDEEQLLLDAAAPHLRPIIIAALDTGMRRGELLQERWEHVDFRRNLLFVSHSKTAGGEGREIPFTERLTALLLANRRDSGLIFTFHDNAIRQIKTAWKAAVRRADIRYRRFHDLRHTFNTRLMEAGVMPDIRKALMGHSSGEDVNSIYTHVELPAKRAAIRKLESWVRDQQSQFEQGGSNDHTKAGFGNAEGHNATAGTAQAVEEENPGGRSACTDQSTP